MVLPAKHGQRWSAKLSSHSCFVSPLTPVMSTTRPSSSITMAPRRLLSDSLGPSVGLASTHVAIGCCSGISIAFISELTLHVTAAPPAAPLSDPPAPPRPPGWITAPIPPSATGAPAAPPACCAVPPSDLAPAPASLAPEPPPTVSDPPVPETCDTPWDALFPPQAKHSVTLPRTHEYQRLAPDSLRTPPRSIAVIQIASCVQSSRHRRPSVSAENYCTTRLRPRAVRPVHAS
jgi:hypothetical protein